MPHILFKSFGVKCFWRKSFLVWFLKVFGSKLKAKQSKCINRSIRSARSCWHLSLHTASFSPLCNVFLSIHTHIAERLSPHDHDPDMIFDDMIFDARQFGNVFV